MRGHSGGRAGIGIVAGILLVAAAGSSPPVGAQDDKFAPILDQVKLCSACHGPEGVPAQPEFPILAGQHLYYLYVQLKDYKSGLRANAVMQPIAAGLEKNEMLLIAEYYSKKSWPQTPALKPDPTVNNAALSVINAGQCVACHLGGFEGDSRVPRLAGQNYPYMKTTMLQFKSKERANSPAKGSLLASFSDLELDQVSRYLSSLKP